MAGSAFNLSCHGNMSVHLSTTAFNRLTDTHHLQVRTSNPRHTGTYRCVYTNRSLEHLNTWIHLYITDLGDPSSIFQTSLRRVLSPPEGRDFLFKCLLTDPSVTNLTLQSENKGWGLPPGMNVTFDPQQGALIHEPKTSFNGHYVCSGLKDGRRVTSRPVHLLVVRRPPTPPSVSVMQKEFYRLEGEEFEVTCVSSNPSHLYMLTWTHPHIQKLNVTLSRYYDNVVLHLNATLRVSAVSAAHAGIYTCTAKSEAGVATATARLYLLERPYLRTYLQHHHTWSDQANATTNSSSLIANISTDTASSANLSSSSVVEAYEGQDVTLTFVIEAHPPVRSQHWTMPTHLDSSDITVQQESYGYRSEFSLMIRRLHQEDRGHYSFHFSNSFFNGSHDIHLRLYSSPSASISLDNDTLTCSSSGYPRPTIWFRCPTLQNMCVGVSTTQVPLAAVISQEGEEEEEGENVRTYLPLSPDHDVTVECIASNMMGESRAVFRSRPPQPVFTPLLIGALSAAATLFLLLLIVFYKWRQKPRYEILWKIIERNDGNNYSFIDPTQLPYNQDWEFPRDKLRLGGVLGSGAFGKVVEATAFGLGTENKVTRVAVKMLKPSAHSEEREALMSELKILSHLGYHDNIVNLLGACTRGGPMLMITEYCRHGDLLNFLRAHAQHFMASMLSIDQSEETAFYKNLSPQQARLRSDSGISCCFEDQEMQPVLQAGVQEDSLSVLDLLWFSYQVALGLDFLSSKNCIHRDVAARNVLLTDRRIAKICDFGLARDIRNDDSYIVQGNARLPVKWMSPESIFLCVYTPQSDVWSYGVLLWEIFSLGKSPYPNVAVDTNFYKMINAGRHMEAPDHAPPEMYQLMTLCWNLEPTNRPTFKTIGQLIHRLLPSTNDTAPHHSEQSAYRNINECREEEEEVDPPPPHRSA